MVRKAAHNTLNKTLGCVPLGVHIPTTPSTKPAVVYLLGYIYPQHAQQNPRLCTSWGTNTHNTLNETLGCYMYLLGYT